MTVLRSYLLGNVLGGLARGEKMGNWRWEMEGNGRGLLRLRPRKDGRTTWIAALLLTEAVNSTNSVQVVAML